MADGSYFNAYTNIGDSFKFIEEAIQVCNSNSGVRPATNGASAGRAGTAVSGKSKASAAAAPLEATEDSID